LSCSEDNVPRWAYYTNCEQYCWNLDASRYIMHVWRSQLQTNHLLKDIRYTDNQWITNTRYWKQAERIRVFTTSKTHFLKAFQVLKRRKGLAYSIPKTNCWCLFKQDLNSIRINRGRFHQWHREKDSVFVWNKGKEVKQDVSWRRFV